MPWTIDKSKADYKVLTNAEQNKFDAFQNAIQNNQMSPKDAAESTGPGADYKCLQGDQYQIRLSQGNRATFTVDNDARTVTILQVGGHT
jgi:mRNA-degrading endonuclease RelE of RelBE toxin-antitoxin system